MTILFWFLLWALGFAEGIVVPPRNESYSVVDWSAVYFTEVLIAELLRSVFRVAVRKLACKPPNDVSTGKCLPSLFISTYGPKDSLFILYSSKICYSYKETNLEKLLFYLELFVFSILYRIN